MKLKEKFNDKIRRRAIIKHLLMYVLFFISNELLCLVCLVSVKHALGIELNYTDITHTIHLIGYIIITFSIVFLVLYSIVQRNAITLPVLHIRERLKGISEGDFDTVLEKENTLFDISEFNPIIDDINTAATQLKLMQNSGQDFINNVSHEFKTPLAVIQNYTKLLQDDSLSNDTRNEYIKVINDSVDDLNSLITTALMLNRIEHQTIFSNKEKYDLSAQIALAIINFENQIEEKKICLDVQLQDEIMITAPKAMVNHIWLNIISNAIKFTNENGNIKILAEVIDNIAVVRVCDEGCGISKKDMPHIFDKYYRGDAKKSIKGNGLGLALVKQSCEALGYTLKVESEVGKGTTFVIFMDL